MATHRSHDTGFAPDFEFHVALACWRRPKTSAARRRPITPDALARQLRAQTFPARPTRTQIERGLAQVRFWRDHVLTRDILDHRAQLALLRTELHAQRRYLDDDLSCLNQMLREADALLTKYPDGARRGGLSFSPR